MACMSSFCPRQRKRVKRNNPWHCPRAHLLASRTKPRTSDGVISFHQFRSRGLQTDFKSLLSWGWMLYPQQDTESSMDWRLMCISCGWDEDGYGWHLKWLTGRRQLPQIMISSECLFAHNRVVGWAASHAAYARRLGKHSEVTNMRIGNVKHLLQVEICQGPCAVILEQALLRW